uniref:Uncharacterized protein TCIL3000_10_6140 n=1 Tax=Trypanosoma congolense (strain IL3000) TaxID=1068625 RepID=G0UWS4_TRYCI|nr:unnamed protein product [Trypanosoma congolense IL3000]
MPRRAGRAERVHLGMCTIGTVQQVSNSGERLVAFFPRAIRVSGFAKTENSDSTRGGEGSLSLPDCGGPFLSIPLCTPLDKKCGPVWDGRWWSMSSCVSHPGSQADSSSNAEGAYGGEWKYAGCFVWLSGCREDLIMWCPNHGHVENTLEKEDAHCRCRRDCFLRDTGGSGELIYTPRCVGKGLCVPPPRRVNKHDSQYGGHRIPAMTRSHPHTASQVNGIIAFLFSRHKTFFCITRARQHCV